MADFCYQCSIEIFGADSEDLKGLCGEHEIIGALCEGCGFISVDYEGKCIAISCEKHSDEEKRTINSDKKLYVFATLRGPDFEIEGEDPMNAWWSLKDREKNNGTLWRCFDEHRNRSAVENEGFTPFDPNNLTQPVWKLKSDA